MKLKEILSNPIFLKYKFIIFPVLSIAISGFLLFFVVFGQVNQTLAKQKEIASLKEKVSNLSNKNDELTKIDATTYKDDLQTLLVAIPEEQDIAGVVGQVVYILKNNNLNLDNVNFSPPRADSGIQSFQINIDVQGERSSLDGLIADINKVPRILQINDLEISSNRNSSKIQSQMTIVTYFQILPQSISGIEEALVKPTTSDLEKIAEIKQKIQKLPVSDTQNATGPTGKTDPFQ